MHKIQKQKGFLMAGSLVMLTVFAHFLTRGSAAAPGVSFAPLRGDGVPATPPGTTVFTAAGGAGVAFSGRLDRTAVLEGGDGQVKMELVLTAEERPRGRQARTPTDLVVILDRSGSMDGRKIATARAAVRELISQLEGQDRFALVTYSSGAELTIPLAPAGAAARQAWQRVVEGIWPGGGTAMSSGLDLALDVLRGTRSGRASRMVLISDGLANEGDASLEGLAARAYRAARGESVVSTIGVGEDFNEVLMTAIADAGTGNYYYLRDVERLAQVLASELATSRETVASAVVVAIDPGRGVRVLDAAGYPLEQHDGVTLFRPGSLFAGQERRIWVTLEVPHDAPGEHPLGVFKASFLDRGEERTLELGEIPVVACVRDNDRYLASIDGDAWARSATEEDYNRLQMKVAEHVRSGHRGAALEAIGAYRLENERLNMKMRRAEVRQKLEELQELESEVADAFEGTDQLRKQNLLSKQRQATGLDGRRIGSKRSHQ